MSAMLTYQPFKGLYVLAALAFETARLPLFLAKYWRPSGRQHPEWTYRQAITMRVFHSALYYIASIQLATPLPLTAGVEKERFTTLRPADKEMYKGPLRSNQDVEPAEIGATWYPAPLTKTSNKTNVRVILHIHGGAFITGDGRTQASGYFAKKLITHTSATHVLCPQYRLSTLPVSLTSNPFPAALQDTLTSYLYLINELGISPSAIILSGDSAGANLSISLLKYIAEHGADLDISNPSACLLWSPWIGPDASASYVHDNDNYATDYLSPPFTYWGSTAYAGPAGLQTLSQPYISHKDRTFRTEVPLWVHTGGAEVLFYDDKEWVEKMQGAGNDVTLCVEKNAPHDVVLMGKILGFDKEATNGVKQAGEWVRGKM
jgi:acetyl esterase/lipase